MCTIRIFLFGNCCGGISSKLKHVLLRDGWGFKAQGSKKTCKEQETQKALRLTGQKVITTASKRLEERSLSLPHHWVVSCSNAASVKDQQCKGGVLVLRGNNIGWGSSIVRSQ